MYKVTFNDDTVVYFIESKLSNIRLDVCNEDGSFVSHSTWTLKKLKEQLRYTVKVIYKFNQV